VLAAPLLVIGGASLASSQVPPTNAGVAHVAVSLPTVLAAVVNPSTPKLNLAQQTSDTYHFINVSALLTTADGMPLAGEHVVFTTDSSVAPGGIICEATTTVRGNARCDSDVTLPVIEFNKQPVQFIATFAGDGSLQPSTMSGDLAVVGDG
jgi:hypothetical protein